MPEPDVSALERALAEAHASEAAARKTRLAIEAALGHDAGGVLIPMAAAAIDWGVSEETVRRWALSGRIHAEKLIGRWHVQAEKPARVEFDQVNHTAKQTNVQP